MDIRRIKQVCKYGWQDSLVLSQEEGIKKSRFLIFLDVLYCFFKYNVWSNQYKKEKLHLVSGVQKNEICLKYQEKNTKRDQWVRNFFDTYKFLAKWSSFKYESSASLQEKRNNAYQKHYHLENKVFFEYGVILQRHHYVESKVVVGKNCKILANVIIDYTGGLTLEEHVSISEGVSILTHTHELFHSKQKDGGSSRSYEMTPLIIHDHAWLGAKAFIHPGVKEIGRRSVIAANTNVKSKVPPYAIVMGNPSKIIGFASTPNDIVEFEMEHYPEEKRIPYEVLEYNYNKYFKSRIKEIKDFIKQ